MPPSINIDEVSATEIYFTLPNEFENTTGTTFSVMSITKFFHG
jgi:hypothetical protein